MSISGGCAVRTLEASKLDAVFEGEHRMTAIYSPSGQLVYALFGSKMENKLIGYKIRCYSKQHQRWLEMVPPLGGLVMEPMHMMWMTMLTSTSFLVSGITEIRSAYCTRKFLHFGTNPPRWTLLEKLTTAVHMNDRWAYDRQNRRVYLFSHENFSLTPQVSIFCIDFSGLNSPEPERTLVFDGQVPWSFRPHTPMVFCEHNNYLLLVNTGNAKLSAEQDKNTPVQVSWQLDVANNIWLTHHVVASFPEKKDSRVLAQRPPLGDCHQPRSSARLAAPHIPGRPHRQPCQGVRQQGLRVRWPIGERGRWPPRERPLESRPAHTHLGAAGAQSAPDALAPW